MATTRKKRKKTTTRGKKATARKKKPAAQKRITAKVRSPKPIRTVVAERLSALEVKGDRLVVLFPHGTNKLRNHPGVIVDRAPPYLVRAA